SIPALLGSFMARDFYNKDIKILSVSEAYNPARVSISPSTGDPFFVSESPVMTTTDAFDLVQKGKIDVMFLGPSQIDSETNVNLSVIGNYYKPEVRLPGGAATAFILPLVGKAILWNVKHSKNSLVKRVDFVTGTAKYSKNKVIIVTNLCVMEYSRADHRWKVTYLYPWSDFKTVQDNTGFEVEDNVIGRIELNEREKMFLDSLDTSKLRLALEF
ncbi:CoA-transferase, partial [Acidianus sp. RZ1]